MPFKSRTAERNLSRDKARFFSLVLGEEQTSSGFLRALRPSIQPKHFPDGPMTDAEHFTRLVIAANHGSLRLLQRGQLNAAKQVCETVVRCGVRSISDGGPAWYTILLLNPFINLGRLAAAQGNAKQACEIYKAFHSFVCEGGTLQLESLCLSNQVVEESYARVKPESVGQALYPQAYEIFFLETFRALMCTDDFGSALTFLETFDPKLISPGGLFQMFPALAAELSFLVNASLKSAPCAQAALATMSLCSSEDRFGLALVELYQAELASRLNSRESVSHWSERLRKLPSPGDASTLREKKALGYLVARTTLGALTHNLALLECEDRVCGWLAQTENEWQKAMLLITLYECGTPKRNDTGQSELLLLLESTQSAYLKVVIYSYNALNETTEYEKTKSWLRAWALAKSIDSTQGQRFTIFLEECRPAKLMRQRNCPTLELPEDAPDNAVYSAFLNDVDAYECRPPRLYPSNIACS